MPNYFLPAPKSIFRRLAMLMMLLLTASSVFAAAGKIQFVAGVAKIINDKKIERPALKGEAVEQGDSILTGANGAVQVALADGGLLAVRPSTQMRIDAYVYSGKAADDNNKSFFSLAKGTFRSITGVIGQHNRQAYKVSTPTATMGIRGTDHEPAVVLPLAPGQIAQTPLQAAPPGTYDRVNSGQTFIQNPDGVVTVNANQVGFAPSGGGSPAILPNVPAFYSSAPKPGPVTKVPAAGQSSATPSTGAVDSTTPSSTDTSASTSTDSTILNTITSAEIAPVSTSGTTNISTNIAITTTTIAPTITNTALPSPSLAPLLPVPGLVGAVVTLNNMPSAMSSYAGAVVVVDPTRQAIDLGAQSEVVHVFDGVSAPSFEFQRGTSALTDQGGFNLFADVGVRVDWGRWQPGFVILQGGVAVTSTGSFHYIYSSDITPIGLVATPGALTGGMYTYVGGTSPTDLSGNLGTLSTAGLLVNFSTQMVTLNITTSINNAAGAPVVLSGAASGGVLDFVSPNIGIAGTTGTPSTATTLKAYGQFVGPTASGAITSFDLRDNTGNGAIGTATFKR